VVVICNLSVFLSSLSGIFNNLHVVVTLFELINKGNVLRDLIIVGFVFKNGRCEV